MTRRSHALRAATLIMVPVGVAITGLAGAAYALMQQDLRRGADDGIVAMAATAADRLDGGAAPASVIPGVKVEAARSLEAFVMVFDDHRRLIASSATIDGAAPKYPSGVFDHARPGGGATTPTWQPRPGLRLASAATSFRGGFVVAAQSLRRIEARIDDLGGTVFASWALTVVACAAAASATAWVLTSADTL